MKKFGLALAIAGVLGFTQVNAQGIVKSRLYGGPKVEANVSNFFLSDMPGAESKMNAGVSAGGFLGFRVSKHFAIQEELMVHYKNSSLKQGGVEGDFETWSADMSIYAMGTWNVGSNRIMVGIGPSIEYSLDGKYKSGGREIDLFKKGDDGQTPFKQYNVAAAITAGYELKCGLQFNASYKIGLMNALDSWEGKMLPSTISLGVAYRFGK